MQKQNSLVIILTSLTLPFMMSCQSGSLVEEGSSTTVVQKEPSMTAEIKCEDINETNSCTAQGLFSSASDSQIALMLVEGSKIESQLGLGTDENTEICIDGNNDSSLEDLRPGEVVEVTFLQDSFSALYISLNCN